MERYQRILKKGSFILAVIWAFTLIVLCCMIYPPYGMLLSVTGALRSSLLSRLAVPSLLIAGAFLLTREPEERKSTGSVLLFSVLTLLIALISFTTKEMPDPSYRGDFTSAAVFLFAPLFLISTVRKRIKAKFYQTVVTLLWTLILAAEVVFSFLPHILFQTVFDLYTVLPYMLFSSLMLLSDAPDNDQRVVILVSCLSLPGFIVFRRFFAVDAIVFPSILFPASACLFLFLTVRRLLLAKKNPEKNPKIEK